MKNHFIIPYFGNKRTEVEEIYKTLDLSNSDTIIEPFCGSGAMSYYISTINPNKFTYIFNDANEQLIELYKIMKSKRKYNKFIKEFNNIIDEILKEKNIDDMKVKYISYISKKDVLGYFLKNKIYNIRPGLFISKISDIKKIDKNHKFPILNFLRNEKVKFTCGDGLKCFEKYYKNPKCVILLDPPYMVSENRFYSNGEIRSNYFIYEFLLDMKDSMANIYLIVEFFWIIKYLYRDNKITKYNKKYTSINKRKVEHCIIEF